MKSLKMLRIFREANRTGALRARVHFCVRGVTASVIAREQRGKAALRARGLTE